VALNSKHPDYKRLVNDWVLMRDLFEGERCVKERGIAYLPPTKGMVIDGMLPGQLGAETYEAYKTRAVFPDSVREAVQSNLGIMWRKPPVIELPSVLEPLREKATTYGESLENLLARINAEQLITGRLGLLLDIAKSDGKLPYVAMYVAESIGNWNDAIADGGLSKLNMVVLDESGYVMDDSLEWQYAKRYRVLQLGDLLANETPGENATYFQGVFDGEGEYSPAGMMAPTYLGTASKQIPFVFVNSKDTIPAPDLPPLLGLGRQVLAIYRGEADYRQNLFMQGQDTLVIIGGRMETDATHPGGSQLRVGAGSMLQLEQDCDAKYIGVGADGLGEMRTAVEADRKRADIKAGQLIGAGEKVESGIALKVRLAAQTNTLTQVAISGAAALEELLQIAAVWMGANPAEVKVTPNLEFSDNIVDGKSFVDLMTARTMGAPLSKKSLHELAVEQGITRMTYEDELNQIEEEGGDGLSMQGLGVGPDGKPLPGDKPPLKKDDEDDLDANK
jgi:hypothetical protein